MYGLPPHPSCGDRGVLMSVAVIQPGEASPHPQRESTVYLRESRVRKGVSLISSSVEVFVFPLTSSAASAARPPSPNTFDDGTPTKKPPPRKAPT